MKVGWWWQLRHMLGVPEHAVSWRERGIATLTAGIGLAAVALLGSLGVFSGDPGSLWLARSIGASAVLVGNHKTLTDFLLPDWDADRPASP